MGPLLALMASLCWGVADFIGGTQARRLPVLSVALVSQATGLVLLSAIVAARGVSAPPESLVAVGLATGIVGAFAFCGLYATLAMGNMARVAPVFGTAAAIPVVVGLLGGDDPSRFQLVGILVAIVGVVCVSRERVAEAQGRGRTPRNTRRALVLALATAASLGTVMIGVDYVADYDAVWATFLMRLSATVVVAILAAGFVSSGRSGMALAGLAVVPLIIVGVLDTAANVLWAVASTEGLLSLVAVLGSVFPAVTVLLALVVHHERLNRIQAGGVGLTLTGSAMITVG